LRALATNADTGFGDRFLPLRAVANLVSRGGAILAPQPAATRPIRRIPA
jgi:hypothetical protein